MTTVQETSNNHRVSPPPSHDATGIVSSDLSAGVPANQVHRERGISREPLPDRCQFTFSDSRQCTMARSDIHPSLCPFHAEREEQLFGSPSPGGSVVGAALDLPELHSACRDLTTAAGVNRALARFSACSRKGAFHARKQPLSAISPSFYCGPLPLRAPSPPPPPPLAIAPMQPALSSCLPAKVTNRMSFRRSTKSNVSEGSLRSLRQSQTHPLRPRLLASPSPRGNIRIPPRVRTPPRVQTPLATQVKSTLTKTLNLNPFRMNTYRTMRGCHIKSRQARVNYSRGLFLQSPCGQHHRGRLENREGAGVRLGIGHGAARPR